MALGREISSASESSRRTALRVQLPREIRELFWDHRPGAISWGADREVVISRVLTEGSWDAVGWLRRALGDAELRSWIVRHRGRGLDRRRLRFWETILRLRHREVTEWLQDPSRQVWDRRLIQ